MFRTARMRKLKIITLGLYTDSLISALHEEGIVEISDISERIQQDPEWGQLLKPSKVTPLTGKISSLLMKTTGISEFLGDALIEKKSMIGLVKSLVKPPVPVPSEVEILDSESLIAKAESMLDDVESETKVIENKLASLDSQKADLTNNKLIAEKLIDLDVDLANLVDTQYTSTIVGRMSVEALETFKKDSASITDEIVILDTKIASEGKKAASDKIVVVTTLKAYKDKIYTLLRKFDFERYEVDDLQGKPKEIIQNTESKLESIESEKSQELLALKEVAKKWDDKIIVLKEQLEIEKERNEIFASFGETENTNMLEAWVPLKQVNEAKAIIDAVCEGHAVVDVEDVGEDDVDVPVLQSNPRYAKPYELLTNMYSPLRYNEVDPTILVAIVFPFFFGFCLTDAFYGIILVIIGIIAYLGMGKINDTMKSFGEIIAACGLWTIFLGLISNGFIGDFSTRILGYGDLPTVIPMVNAFVNPQNILVGALICGIVYTNLGFIIGIINNFRYGHKKEALGSQIVWFILEAGIVFLALGFLMPAIGMIGMAIGGALIAASLGILLYTGGAYGIMDIFSYMGDLLSYARLLALCLATGGIAMTVNIVAQLVYTMFPPIPVVGAALAFIIAVIIFIFGHIANLLFQTLGAFINSLRLHYVEFFAQFYMSGKNQFKTFNANRVFTKLRR
ncbi:MAG: V-type ATP synthase subunit I [Methanobacteriaceae archaeon]